MSCVDDIPVAHTPPGGWTDWPEPILAGCDDPVVDGAPDLDGWWRTVKPILHHRHIDRLSEMARLLS